VPSVTVRGQAFPDFKEYYNKTLGSELPFGSEGSFWDCDRKLLDTGFGDTVFPFPKVKRFWHHESRRMNVDDFFGYLRTWSAYRKYVSQTGSDPLVDLRQKMDQADGLLDVTFPYFLILARAPAESPTLSLKAAYSGGKAAVCEDCVKVSETHYPRGLNANFLLGEGSAIVTEHVTKFEDPEKRDIARAAPEVMKMLATCAGLSKTATIADIGAGTGLFLESLSEAAESVLAVEISPAFLTHLRTQVDTKGFKNVSVVEGQPSDPCLTRASIDIAFICDVYHHFEYPKTFCNHLREALRPGGRLVVIDFIRDEAVHKSHPPGWILDHVRAGQEVFRAEIEEAGFVCKAEPAIPGLSENYCMIFEPRDG